MRMNDAREDTTRSTEPICDTKREKSKIGKTEKKQKRLKRQAERR